MHQTIRHRLLPFHRRSIAVRPAALIPKYRRRLTFRAARLQDLDRVPCVVEVLVQWEAAGYAVRSFVFFSAVVLAVL